MQQINYPTESDLSGEHRRHEEWEEAMAKKEAEASGYSIPKIDEKEWLKIKMEEWKNV